mmetsp:Transcript_49543/g.94660  ORF Transcript_49543/g.94660 Transcript_49543/m.94660 type:complete len:334 (-) Transcript_49543:1313-2314(-)
MPAFSFVVSRDLSQRAHQLFAIFSLFRHLHCSLKRGRLQRMPPRRGGAALPFGPVHHVGQLGHRLHGVRVLGGFAFPVRGYHRLPHLRVRLVFLTLSGEQRRHLRARLRNHGGVLAFALLVHANRFLVELQRLARLLLPSGHLRQARVRLPPVAEQLRVGQLELRLVDVDGFEVVLLRQVRLPNLTQDVGVGGARDGDARVVLAVGGLVDVQEASHGGAGLVLLPQVVLALGQVVQQRAQGDVVLSVVVLQDLERSLEQLPCHLQLLAFCLEPAQTAQRRRHLDVRHAVFLDALAQGLVVEALRLYQLDFVRASYGVQAVRDVQQVLDDFHAV